MQVDAGPRSWYDYIAACRGTYYTCILRMAPPLPIQQKKGFRNCMEIAGPCQILEE